MRVAWQGTKFLERFDANTYVVLTRLIDSHDVGRGRGGVAAALSRVEAPVLVVGISSDVLYPVEMQRQLAAMLPHGTLHVVDSMQGHDGFLLECSRIGVLIIAALESEPARGGAAPISPHEASSRQTLKLPRTQHAMNELLARTKSPKLSPNEEWFFGI